MDHRTTATFRCCIGVLVAVMSSTSSASAVLTLRTDSTWILGGVSSASVGGRVSSVSAGLGQVAIAFGNQIDVHSQDGRRRLEHYYTGKASKHLAISRLHIAAVLDDDTVILVKRSAGIDQGERIGNKLILPDPGGGSVSALAMDDEWLIAAMSSGILYVYDVSSVMTPVLVSAVNLSSAFAGKWWVRDLVLDDSLVYAAIYDSSQESAKARIVSIGMDGSGDWVASEVARLVGRQQPVRIDVEDNQVALLTSDEVLVVDTVTGVIRALTRSSPDKFWVRDISLDSGMLYLLGFADTLDIEHKESTFEIVKVRIHGSGSLETEARAAINKRVWEYSTFDVSGDYIYLDEEDQVTVLVSAPVFAMTEEVSQIVAPAIASLVIQPSGDLVVARPRGICRLASTGVAIEWCGGRDLSADKLLAIVNDIVVGMEPYRVYAMSVEGAEITIRDEIALDESASHRFMDIAQSSQGIVVLKSVNPPRSPQLLDFEIDVVSISAGGELSSGGGLVVNTPGCSSPQLGVIGKWLGLLCGDSLWEYELRAGGLAFARRHQIDDKGLSMAVSETGILAIGTDRGLRVFDFESRAELIVRPNPSGSGSSVSAVAAVGGCFVAVLAEGEGAVSGVWYYCPDAEGDTSFRGVQVAAFTRAGRPYQPQIISSVTGFTVWVVTGTGTAIRLTPDTVAKKIMFPVVLMQQTG